MGEGIEKAMEEMRERQKSLAGRIAKMGAGAMVRWYSSRDKPNIDFGEHIINQGDGVGWAISLQLEDLVTVMEQAVKNAGASVEDGMVNDTMTVGLCRHTATALRKLAAQNHPVIVLPRGPKMFDMKPMTNDELVAIEKLIQRLSDKLDGDNHPDARMARGQDPIRPAKRMKRDDLTSITGDSQP